MIFKSTHIRIGAGLLGLIFLASWTLKTSHALMLTHVHHVAPVCETGHKTPATHLHDERYNPDDCSVCAFLFAVPELAQHSMFPKTPKPFALRRPINIQKHDSALEHFSVLLRGPPAQHTYC